jgi:hypothetical protein
MGWETTSSSATKCLPCVSHTCTVHNLPAPSVSKEPVAPRNLTDCRQRFGRTDRQGQRVTNQLPDYTASHPVRPISIAQDVPVQATTAYETVEFAAAPHWMERNARRHMANAVPRAVSNPSYNHHHSWQLTSKLYWAVVIVSLFSELVTNFSVISYSNGSSASWGQQCNGKHSSHKLLPTAYTDTLLYLTDTVCQFPPLFQRYSRANRKLLTLLVG